MLPNDTMKVSELRNYYGCMLNSLIEEFERIRKINAKRHKLNITNFIRLLSSQCTNLHVCLADRLSEFNQLKDENDIHNIDGGIQLKKVENLVDITNEEIHNNNNDDFDFENIDYIDEEGNIRNENPKEDNMKNNNKEKNKKEEIKNEKIVNEEDIKKDEIKENKNENNEEKNKNEEDDKKENKNEENNKENNKNENKIDDNKNE